MNESNKPQIIQSMALAGSAAIIAINFTHPIDLYKTRLQAGNFNLNQLIKQEGILSFWKGIKPAYLREASYTSIKLGYYGPIKEYLNADKSFIMKFLAGSISGTLGVLVGNPFDVLKTLSITNTNTNVPLNKNIMNIYNQQGLSGFYRGVSANISRSSVLNGTKMSTYDQIKNYTNLYTGWSRKDIRCQGTSAFFAGFMMSVTSAPFDMVRTALMNQPPDKKIYSGFLDASLKIYQQGGISKFYTGFLPIWMRFAPGAILQLTIYDNMLSFFGYSNI